MGFLIQIGIGIVLWFIISYIVIEGSNPFRPQWVNNISAGLLWVLKITFIGLLIAGLSGNKK